MIQKTGDVASDLELVESFVERILAYSKSDGGLKVEKGDHLVENKKSEVAALGVITIPRACFERCRSMKENNTKLLGLTQNLIGERILVHSEGEGGLEVEKGDRLVCPHPLYIINRPGNKNTSLKPG